MSVKMNITIREMKTSEYAMLADFLYEAIFVPEGMKAPSKSILESPELQLYIANFGDFEEDKAMVVEVDNAIVGAVWVRIMKDYGHVDDETPSFAIALYKEYRGHRLGTKLMKAMLTMLKDNGYKQASLAVQKANYALSMYRKLGFVIVDENEEEYIMVYSL